MGDIQTKLNGNLGQIVLNRPSSRNAISRQMWLDLPLELLKLQERGANLIVFAGAGDSFAAGADITELKDLDTMAAATENWHAIVQALNFIYQFDLPTVAAIDGPCLGGGCLLASACDLRYASRRSVFSVPVAKLGIALDDASLGRLAALVGLARAKELIYRARILSAEEASQWGLVNQVFADERFDDELSQLLSEISINSQSSIKEAKSSFQRFLVLPANEDNDRSVIESYLSSEFRDRIKRALAKE